VVKNLFDRLADKRPQNLVAERKELPRGDIEDAQKLLDWLQRWAKPSLSVRDIRIYGPYSLRNQESAIRAAETLARQGWLIRTKTHWQLVRPRDPHAPNRSSLVVREA
jgi:hypothetical protein